MHVFVLQECQGLRWYGPGGMSMLSQLGHLSRGALALRIRRLEHVLDASFFDDNLWAPSVSVRVKYRNMRTKRTSGHPQLLAVLCLWEALVLQAAEPQSKVSPVKYRTWKCCRSGATSEITGKAPDQSRLTPHPL